MIEYTGNDVLEGKPFQSAKRSKHNTAGPLLSRYITNIALLKANNNLSSDGMNSSVYGKANNKFAIEYGQEMNSGRNTTSILVLLKEGLIITITKFSNLLGYQLP